MSVCLPVCLSSCLAVLLTVCLSKELSRAPFKLSILILGVLHIPFYALLIAGTQLTSLTTHHHSHHHCHSPPLSPSFSPSTTLSLIIIQTIGPQCAGKTTFVTHLLPEGVEDIAIDDVPPSYEKVLYC